MDKLKQIEDSINDYEIKEVNLNTILGLKKLADNITNFEKLTLWKGFETKFDSIIEKFNKLDIIVDSNMKDFKEYPKNIIIIMKDTISHSIKIESDKDTISHSIKIESDKEKIVELNKIHTNLIKEYIEQEDNQEELETLTNYLYDLLDKKFEWLEDNEDFDKISELLEKISKEICEGILRFIDQKKQFYSEYYKGYNKLYINNCIKSYILYNFYNIFFQACLDVLDQNNIKDDNQMKMIIGLYYDYTKSSTKMMLTLNDIDFRINSHYQ